MKSKDITFMKLWFFNSFEKVAIIRTARELGFECVINEECKDMVIYGLNGDNHADIDAFLELAGVEV